MIPFVDTSERAVAFLLGLFLFGLGVGAMLTPSVNVVQSSFPEELQGEISGLSRSVSNLGSSFGTAIAGTILVSAIATGNQVVCRRDDRPRRVCPARTPRRTSPAPTRRSARSANELNSSDPLRARGDEPTCPLACGHPPRLRGMRSSGGP